MNKKHYNKSMLIVRIEGVIMVVSFLSVPSLAVSAVFSMTIVYGYQIRDVLLPFLFVAFYLVSLVVSINLFLAVGSMIRALEPPTVTQSKVTVTRVTKAGKIVDSQVRVNDEWLEE